MRTKIFISKEDIDQKDINRFWSKVDIRGENECWPWKASSFQDGRGSFSISINGIAKQTNAPRFIWIINNGEIPDGIEILHTCDHPWCCNYNHFFSGTHKDNMQDMISKGRKFLPVLQRPKRPNTKLTEDDVKYIRKNYKARTKKFGSRALAKKFGVHASTIESVVYNRCWIDV